MQRLSPGTDRGLRQPLLPDAVGGESGGISSSNGTSSSGGNLGGKAGKGSKLSRESRSDSLGSDVTDDGDNGSDPHSMGRKRSMALLNKRRNSIIHSDALKAVFLEASLFLVGTLLAVSIPRSEELHGSWKWMSSVIGYTYFCSWSLSFWPQIYINYQNKHTSGLSLDFQLLNLLGFACYTAFTCAFYFSNAISREYSKRHGGAVSKVQFNDVLFASHALFATAITNIQIWWYNREFSSFVIGRNLPRPHLSTVCAWAMSIAVVLMSAYAIMIDLYGGVRADRPWNWADWLYFVSYIKLGITIVKYIPQVRLNIKRKSTVGWSIWNILLDFNGGVLSILQLIGDCANTHDWSGILGYPTKFGLGFVSIGFDIIFILQHYYFYAGASTVVVGNGLSSYNSVNDYDGDESEEGGPATEEGRSTSVL